MIPFIYTILHSKLTFYSPLSAALISFRRLSEPKSRRKWQKFVDSTVHSNSEEPEPSICLLMWGIKSLKDLLKKPYETNVLTWVWTSSFSCREVASVLCSVFCVLCSLFCVLSSLFSVLCSVFGRRWTSEVRSSPCSLGHESTLCLLVWFDSLLCKVTVRHKLFSGRLCAAKTLKVLMNEEQQKASRSWTQLSRRCHSDRTGSRIRGRTYFR